MTWGELVWIGYSEHPGTVSVIDGDGDDFRRNVLDDSKGNLCVMAYIKEKQLWDENPTIKML